MSVSHDQGAPVPFSIDLFGRLKNIDAPVSRSLQALFEAVANAFDATDHIGTGGRITVRVLRKLTRPSIDSESPAEGDYKFEGYEVEDNGTGFTPENVQHFMTCDTRHKGKGVGRLLWLRVFDRSEIDSVYRTDDTAFRVEFTFKAAHGGVRDADVRPKAAPGESNRTRVRLLSPEPKRVRHLPTGHRQLAAKLLDHFLLHFAVSPQQSLVVEDSATGESTDVAALFAESFGGRYDSAQFEVRGHAFVLHHLLVRAGASDKNLLNLCAARRVVLSEPLARLVPEVGTGAVAANGLRYHGYVTGAHLDEIADDERAGLKFEPEGSPDDGPGMFDVIEGEPERVRRTELMTAIAQKVREHLGTHIEEVRRHKMEDVERFVHRQPQFAPYVERAKEVHIDRLPAGAGERAIEEALYAAKIDAREDMQRTVSSIIAASPAHAQTEAARHALLLKFTVEANRANESALAEYVCTRRAVLDVLKYNLGTERSDDYEKEKVIHDLFFPRGHTGGSVEVGPAWGPHREIAHLWLLDERLAFHRLVASDLPLNKLKAFLSDSGGEPDVVVFDPAFLTAEGDEFTSVALVEFKRPGLQSYSKDPVQQLISYVQDLREGTFVDRKGRKRHLSPETVVFCYLLCDPSPALQKLLGGADFTKLPNGRGAYRHHTTLNAFIEVLYYEQLVQNAEMRNAAFFKKLGVT